MASVSKRWRANIRSGEFLSARRINGGEPFVVAIAGESEETRTPHNLVHLLLDDKWVPLCPLPHPTNMHCAVMCREEIYVLGGHHATQPMSFINPEPCGCVMVYSPLRNSWRATRLLNKARALTAICSIDRKIRVFGGKSVSRGRGRHARVTTKGRRFRFYPSVVASGARANVTIYST